MCISEESKPQVSGDLPDRTLALPVRAIAFAYGLAPFETSTQFDPTPAPTPLTSWGHLLDLAFHFLAFAVVGAVNRAGSQRFAGTRVACLRRTALRNALIA